MRLESYKMVLRIVTFSTGLITAIGVVLNSLFLPLTGITAGMLILYAAKQRVEERDRDERTTLINLKAAQATLSIAVIIMAFAGLSLILLSREGFLDYEQMGFYLAIQALMIMSAKAFFDWYYKNRLGG